MNEADPNCGICLERVTNAAILSGCDHSFCFECIKEWSTVTNLCPLCRREFLSLKTDKQGSGPFEVAIKRKQQRVLDQGLDGWVGSSGSEDEDGYDSFVVDDDHISYSADDDELDIAERRLSGRNISFTFDEDEDDSIGSMRVESDSEEQPVLYSDSSDEAEPDSADNTFIVADDHVSYSSESDDLDRVERRLNNAKRRKRSFQQLTQREEEVVVLRRVKKRGEAREERGPTQLNPRRATRQSQRVTSISLCNTSEESFEETASQAKRKRLISLLNNSTESDNDWLSPIGSRHNKHNKRLSLEIEEVKGITKEKNAQPISLDDVPIVVNAAHPEISPKRQWARTKARESIEAWKKKRAEERLVLTLSGSGDIPKTATNTNTKTNPLSSAKKADSCKREEARQVVALPGSSEVSNSTEKPVEDITDCFRIGGRQNSNGLSSADSNAPQRPSYDKLRKNTDKAEPFAPPPFRRVTSESYWNNSLLLSSIAKPNTNTSTNTNTRTAPNESAAPVPAHSNTLKRSGSFLSKETEPRIVTNGSVTTTNTTTTTTTNTKTKANTNTRPLFPHGSTSTSNPTTTTRSLKPMNNALNHSTTTTGMMPTTTATNTTSISNITSTGNTQPRKVTLLPLTQRLERARSSENLNFSNTNTLTNNGKKPHFQKPDPAAPAPSLSKSPASAGDPIATDNSSNESTIISPNNESSQKIDYSTMRRFSKTSTSQKPFSSLAMPLFNNRTPQ